MPEFDTTEWEQYEAECADAVAWAEWQLRHPRLVRAALSCGVAVKNALITWGMAYTGVRRPIEDQEMTV